MRKPTIVSDHVPVLLSDFSSFLPRLSGVWIDGTFGDGGYSRRLLDSGASKVIAIDLDPDVLPCAAEFEKLWPDRFIIFQNNFCKMTELVSGLGLKNISGVVLDVGISSMQIDQSIRGFSFKNDGPLDMRFAQKGPSAKDFINEANESLIAEVLLTFGEERHAKAIAKRIVAIRKKCSIDSTHQLANIIVQVLGNNSSHKTHPATRSFQAIRVAINAELQNLIIGLISAYGLLRIGGYLAVITFHSLEDRIVKRFLNFKVTGNNSLDEVKCVGGNSEPIFNKLNNRPVTATPEETIENPRARSAKLRIARKISHQDINVDPSFLGLPEVSTKLRKFQCE